MNNEQPHSGSRWEPTPAGAGTARQAEDETAPHAGDRDTGATRPTTAAPRDAETTSQPDPAAPAGATAGAENIAATGGQPYAAAEAEHTGPDATPDAPHDATIERTDVPAAHTAPGPWPLLPPVVPVGGPIPPRRNRRRGVLLAAVAAGLLALGGVGGFAAGHATADQAPPVGLAGVGEYGHHRGPFSDGGADGQLGGDRSGGTGTGRTGTST